MITQNQFNQYATHPLQSYEWGEFRKATGIKVVRSSTFQLTIHPIPHTPWTIGYLPKGILPTKEMIEELKKIGKEHHCIFIQLEPNIEKDVQLKITDLGIVPSAHPLFTKYTLVLDLTKSEDELLKNMTQKTRYNIKVAQRHGVKITEDDSPEAFEEYWKLLQQTTQRQGFYAHTKKYHGLMFQTLGVIPTKRKRVEGSNSNQLINFHESDSSTSGSTSSPSARNDKLQAHLFLAKYKNQTLTAWILFTFKNTLYYPYGASSREHREVMAQNLMMWETIKFGKKLGLKTFDMWGSLGENPDTTDPWYGFHRFKMGYGPTLIEFVGSYDLVINPILYQIYKLVDKFRWILLKKK